MEWLLIPAITIAVAFLWSYAKSKGRNEALTRELSLVQVKAYANSFVGLQIEIAKIAIDQGFETAIIVETDWSEGEVKGRQLSAEFSSHEITLFAFDGRIVTASVQILSG